MIVAWQGPKYVSGFRILTVTYIPISSLQMIINPGSMYFFKVNDEKAKTMRKICLKLTIKISERHQRRCSGVFTVVWTDFTDFTFEHVCGTPSSCLCYYEIMLNTLLVFLNSKHHLVVFKKAKTKNRFSGNCYNLYIKVEP